MDSIVQILVSQLGAGAVSEISKRMGVDDQKAQQAVGMALPIIIGALNRNSSSSAGAEALTSALQKNHDGSILNDLTGAVGNQATLDDGTAILGHVLGEQRGALEGNVSRATGLKPEEVAQIFAVLAPIVMGALGQMQRKQELDSQGVANLLQQERSTVEKTSSGLVQLLDMDGDGDVSEEIISLGSSLLGGLLGGGK